MTQVEWIAVDWGTSNLRAWAMGEDGNVLALRTSPKGMGTLQQNEFEAALLESVADLLSEGSTMPVVCCGMVGARQGWTEAAYMDVPCLTPDASQCAVAPVADPRIDVRILPGVKQDDPADVMRGEETQILGYLAEDPGFEGVLCLPGTHTKWVEIAGGRIRSFRTSMTGELFALLSKSSVLRHSVGGKDMDAEAFATAVREANGPTPALPGSLFSIRAADLLHGQTQASATARLSGLLIGSELAGMKAAQDGRPIVLLGAEALSERYREALAILGHSARIVDADRTTLTGLTAAYTSLKETGTWIAP
jgi:2-dehydro-3-deoxygalactonokinase